MTRFIKTLRTYLAVPVSSATADIDRDIADELAFHLGERTQEGIDQGLTETDARSAAQQRFGDLSTIRTACRDTDRGDLLMFHHLHLAVTAALVAALAAVIWMQRTNRTAVASIEPALLTRLEAAVSKTVPADNGGSGDTASVVALDHEQLTGSVTGHVTDESGQPIAGATVLVVVKRWPNGRYHQEPFATTTGNDGRFGIDGVYDPQTQHAAHVSVIDDSHVLESSYQLQSTGELDAATFRLASASPLTVRCEDPSGNPVAGIEVLPHERVAADGDEHLVYFCGSAPVNQTTDNAGHVKLPGYQAGDTAVVWWRASCGEWRTHEFVVPAAGEVVSMKVGSDV